MKMKSLEKPMSLAMKLIFWFVVVNAYLGGLTLIIFSTDTATLFYWKITPPVNAALFGTLYLVAGTAALVAVLRGRWETARYLIPMVLAFGSLLLLTTLLHLDKFIQGPKLYYWTGVYIVAPVAALVFYIQHERAGANWQIEGEPVSPATRWLALGIGAALALGVVVSFIFPSLITDLAPWPISSLMTRVFASWFSSLAAGLLWFAVERDWSRLRPIPFLMIGTAIAMLAILLLHSGELKPEMVNLWVLCAGLVGVGLTGSLMLLWQRKAGTNPATLGDYSVN